MTNGDATSTSAPYIAASTAQATDAWANEAAASGHRGTQCIAWADQRGAPAFVAQALGLGEGSTVVARRRIVLLDDQPVELADAYYPTEVAAGTALADVAKIRGGAAALLASMGRTAAEVREEVTARMPTDDEREALHLDPGEPVLILARTSIDAAGRPFEYAVMTMVARGRVLRYRTQGG